VEFLVGAGEGWAGQLLRLQHRHAAVPALDLPARPERKASPNETCAQITNWIRDGGKDCRKAGSNLPAGQASPFVSHAGGRAVPGSEGKDLTGPRSPNCWHGWIKNGEVTCAMTMSLCEGGKLRLLRPGVHRALVPRLRARARDRHARPRTATAS
jgi:hypothetical protein